MTEFPTLLDLVGNTPVIRLDRFAASRGVKCELLAKLESANPGNSVKDRIGLRLIEAAERDGHIAPGDTIVEPTSGNTGLGLAMAAIQRGYRCVFVMPDKISLEKQNLLRAFGAEVVVCPTDVDPEDPRSYYSVSDRLARELPRAFKPDQYHNQANPQAHYETTGPELWRQTDGHIDVFACGVGTGGTVTGVGRYLKEKNPKLIVAAGDPEGSIYTTPEDEIHSYLVEGIGEDFWPTTFDRSVVDHWVQVSDRDSFRAAIDLARIEGVLTGGSGGTALVAAIDAARDLDSAKRVVVLIPDTGRGYLSKMYNPAWLVEHGMMSHDEAAALQPIEAHDLLRAAGIEL